MLLDKLDYLEGIVLRKHLPGRHNQLRHAPNWRSRAAAKFDIDYYYITQPGAHGYYNMTDQDIIDMFYVKGVGRVDVWVGEEFSGELTVEASLYDEDGKFVGECTRIFARGRDGEPLYVENSALQLTDTNVGIGSQLYYYQLRAYRRMGYPEVRLQADISIGRYAWARKGFDYAYSENAARKSWVMWSWADSKGIQLPGDGEPRFGSAKEIADYDPGITLYGKDIRNDDVPPDMPLHVGKAFMLDEDGHGSWEGVLKLR